MADLHARKDDKDHFDKLNLTDNDELMGELNLTGDDDFSSRSVEKKQALGLYDVMKTSVKTIQDEIKNLRELNDFLNKGTGDVDEILAYMIMLNNKLIDEVDDLEEKYKDSIE